MRGQIGSALVPWWAAWVPWRYERRDVLFLRKVDFPIFGLAAPPPGFSERLGGRGEAGTGPAGSRIRTKPVSVGLAYERGHERISVTSNQPSDITMRGLARPANARPESWVFSVAGEPVTFNGWRGERTWQCEAAVDDATIQITAELDADDIELGLVVRTDLLDACVLLQHLTPG